MTPRLKTSSIAFSLPLVLALALPLTRAAEQAQEVSPSKATPVQKASTVAQTVPAPATAPHDGTTVTRSIRDWHPELPSSKTAPAAAKPAAAGRAQQPVGPFPSEPAVEVDLKHAPGFP